MLSFKLDSRLSEMLPLSFSNFQVDLDAANDHTHVQWAKTQWDKTWQELLCQCDGLHGMRIQNHIYTASYERGKFFNVVGNQSTPIVLQMLSLQCEKTQWDLKTWDSTGWDPCVGFAIPYNKSHNQISILQSRFKIEIT